MMRKASKWRVKSHAAQSLFCLEGLCLSRTAAIEKVQQHIEATGIDSSALRLIELFNIEPEELAEAGLSYEHLKAVEQRIIMM